MEEYCEVDLDPWLKWWNYLYESKCAIRPIWTQLFWVFIQSVQLPFWLDPDPSTPSELDIPFVGSGMVECLWPFLFVEPWFPEDPFEDEKGDIKPVFLMVELNEPMTASTCIILKSMCCFCDWWYVQKVSFQRFIEVYFFLPVNKKRHYCKFSNFIQQWFHSFIDSINTK